MAYLTTTQAKAAFKKAFGKAHTANEKEVSNESIKSYSSVKTSDLFADPISSDPIAAIADGVAVDCTGNAALNLVLDPTSDGLAYFAVIPEYHELKTKINPETGVLYQTGDRVTRVIPDIFGEEYRVVAKIGSVTISPFALENWIFDAASGVLTSEAPLNFSDLGSLHCYVYIGRSVQEYIDTTVIGGGSPGSLAFYSADRSISPKTSIRVDPTTDEPSTLTLGEASNLEFRNSDNSFAVSLRASNQLLASYELKLPISKATESGQVLAADTNGQLFFQPPSSVQKGSIGLPVGSKMVSIIYDEPFSNVPSVVQVQWAILSSVTYPAIIPVVVIDKITREGFIARWTHAVPSEGYVLRWETYLEYDYTPKALKAFVVGNGYTATINSFAMDYNSFANLSASLGSSLSFMQSYSATTAGYIAGGRQEDGTVVSTVTKLAYATESLISVAGSLVEPKAKAASVGNQVKGYFAGGRNDDSASLSILGIDHISEVSTVLGISLLSSSESKGSFNSVGYGYIVRDGNDGNVSKITIDTNTLSEVTSVGYEDVSCGCNSAGSGLGYLSRDTTSNIIKYDTSTDTVSVLTATLSESEQGQSCAFNSLLSGFFVGSEGIDEMSFALETVTAISTSLQSLSPGSANAFQSQGLL